jgi:hypothetical protein
MITVIDKKPARAEYRRGTSDEYEYIFGVQNLTEYTALPTPTVAASVRDLDGVVRSVCAAVTSKARSDDLTIIGEIQGDAAWHRIVEVS